MERKSNYVNAIEVTPTRVCSEMQAPSNPFHEIGTGSVTQHVEMKTSAEDRARGFVMVTRGLGLAFAVGAAVVTAALGIVPVLSLAMLGILAGVYAAVWLAAYWMTLRQSAEGTSRFREEQYWKMLREDRKAFWREHRRRTEGE